VAAQTYRRRIVDDLLDLYMSQVPALALEGAKGVGKTETGLQRAASVFKLDEEGPLEVVRADIARVIDGDPPVLIDEWQRYPPVWDAVRNADDRGAAPGSFLLTGSAHPTDGPAHTGAGRILSVRMRPLSLAERLDEPPTVRLGTLLDGGRGPIAGETTIDLGRYVDEILRSGFPGLRRYTGRVLRDQLDGYLRLIVEKDFRDELDQDVRRPDRLRRWMAAYAAASSTTTSAQTLRNTLRRSEGDAPSRQTALAWTEALKRLFVLEPVRPWRPARNPLRELGQAEKHQLVDPALAARLVRATPGTLLDGQDDGLPVPRSGTLLGALFESLVTQSVRTYLAVVDTAETEPRHFRTHRGDHEIDLIVEREDGRVLAIEVKLTATPSDDDVKHLKWLAREIGDDLIDSCIVTTGKTAYRRPDGIAVVPASLLGP